MIDKIKWFAIIPMLVLLFCGAIYAKQYKGAELRTRDTFKYGRYEVSYIPANREGVISSFFTYHEISNVNQWNEIDFEFVGRYDNQIQINIISPGQKNHEASIPLAFNPYEDFHTYAFEWTPDYVAWFVDGVEIHRQTEDHVSEINREQKIMMNIWPPNYTDWVGKIKPENLPAYAYYDWVSYSSYTPGNGDTGTNNDFTFQWKDEFNEYDSNRWGKGTHTWTGNESDFVVENARFQDGMLILCLTKEGETGLQDNQDPVFMWGRETSRNNIILQFGEELDSESAETISNYAVPGVTITEAMLSGDKTSVKLITQNFNPDQTYNVIVQNIYDDTKENVLSAAAKTLKNIDELQFPVKVNVGGEAFESFKADQEYLPSLHYGHMDGSPAAYAGNLQIGNTEIPELYRFERSRLVTFRFDLPRGIYNVKLHFAENYFEEADRRVFDVTIENNKILDDFDIYAEVGKNTAHVVESEVFVDDDRLDIYFTNEIDYAVLSGIEVDQVTTGFEENNGRIQNRFELLQNFPNPFNPSTTIGFSLNQSSEVQLKIFDSLGKEAATLLDEKMNSGSYNKLVDLSNFSSGVYFYRIIVDGIKSQTKKMVYLK